MSYIIGQIFGGIAVILGFISYQTKSSRSILMMQIATGGVFCLHYLLIGGTSGLVLNTLGIVCKIFYCNKKDNKVLPVFFSLVMGIAGALSWQGFHSLFVIAGLMINTFFLSSTNPMTIRRSILVTSPLVIIYNVFILSYGGIIYESVAIVSSIVGIIRYSKNQRLNISAPRKTIRSNKHFRKLF